MAHSDTHAPDTTYIVQIEVTSFGLTHNSISFNRRIFNTYRGVFRIDQFQRNEKDRKTFKK